MFDDEPPVDPASLPVVIIGAGPCGLAAAVALERVGIHAIVLEKHSLVSSIAGYPMYMTFFSTADKIAIGGLPFTVATEKPTRRDALEYYRGVVSHFGLAVRPYEKVERVVREGDGFLVYSHPRGLEPVETHARAVVFATGYFGTPNRLGVPGEGQAHVTHFFHEGHEAFQRTALVVGGGNSAVETSLDLCKAGARVTMVHFGATFDKNIKPWIRPEFETRVATGDIVVRWGTRVKAIEHETAVVTTPPGEERVAAQHVYLMTGYTPRPELLHSLGVTLDPVTGVPPHDSATMETPTPNVFIAGVLASGLDANKIFIENGRDHGNVIASTLAARFAR